MSLFASVTQAPHDPILGLTEAFIADPRSDKVNLGVGVYTDANGEVPLLRAVAAAERDLAATAAPRGYLPIDGLARYDAAVQRLLFGADSPALAAHQVTTVQALGGTGALRVGADFLQQLAPTVPVAISDPTWANHHGVFARAGFEVVTYPYFDATRNALDLEGMLHALAQLPRGAVVVLHACCHNPTGVDPTPEQWQRIIQVLKQHELMPFVDVAYQGFAESLHADTAPLRRMVDAGLALCAAHSFSKSFSLYGERVGALSVVATDADEARRVRSQLKRIIRATYSNPPTHGAALVTAVLESDALRALWHEELDGMRLRIRQMRDGLVEHLQAAGASGDFEFIRRQRGMFSFSGLNRAQVQRLREEFAIYVVGSGRICVAALNESNLEHVAQAVAAVSD